jgi:hypothetical protein
MWTDARRCFWFVLLVTIALLACSRSLESTHDTGEAVGAAVIQVNCGGGAVGTFAADELFSGGSTYTTGAAITTSGVASAAPAAVYQSERYGDQSYTFGGLAPNGSYTVRLHFAEIYWTSAGAREFNVILNGTRVLTNLDIFALVGANTALVQDFATTASSTGQITIQYVTVRDNAKASGIEILAGEGATDAGSSPDAGSNDTGDGEAGSSLRTYTTSFPLSETPISESANWLNADQVVHDGAYVYTSGGRAYGHSGPGSYQDALARLTGTWAPNQMAQGTVYAGSVNDAPEVELHLRASTVDGQWAGYEISHSVSGGQNGDYLIVVELGHGTFTILQQLNGSQYSVQTGDVVKATIIGNVITVYKNGVQETQVVDGTWSVGSPGLGFNERTNGDYAFTSYMAAELP